MNCPKCNDSFRLDEARSNYNSYVATYNNASDFSAFNFHFDYDSDFSSGECMCYLCAIDDVEEKVAAAFAEAGVEEFDDEDDDSEMISVHDAANIYRSKGCDEDYRFGYSHEELIEALK